MTNVCPPCPLPSSIETHDLGRHFIRDAEIGSDRGECLIPEPLLDAIDGYRHAQLPKGIVRSHENFNLNNGCAVQAKRAEGDQARELVPLRRYEREVSSSA